MIGTDTEPGQHWALLTDLYQLTMLQAYVKDGMTDTAVFDLFVRRLPSTRNYLVACGLADVLDYIETLHFSQESLSYLYSLGKFKNTFLDYLADMRFTGTVRALPEGSVFFQNEPIIEVIAPLPEAQLIETYLLNQVHFQTLVASKAARVVTAARGRMVVDFGLRRYHGTDAGLKAARATYITGVYATSNVLAGQLYGIPVMGTMAHSYVLAHDDELAAFERFMKLYPETVLLVDTYDTVKGVRNVVKLAAKLGNKFRVQGIRLDSGNMAALARESRQILDEAGLNDVKIFVSGSLDETQITDLMAARAPIDGFGVGTRMGTSADAPYLNIAYKLVAYGGKNKMKLSPNKTTLPGQKQLYRELDNDKMIRDVMALHEETLSGQPMLHTVMEDGKRLTNASNNLDSIRRYCQKTIASLPPALTRLEAGNPPYPVHISSGLAAARDDLVQSLL